MSDAIPKIQFNSFFDFAQTELNKALQIKKALEAENKELREKLEEKKQQVKQLTAALKELQEKWEKVRNDFFLAGIKLDFEIKNKK